MDWVGIIGFRHEVAHTGVLRALLETGDAASVARALTGNEHIETVGEPQQEARLRERVRRSVDLAANLTLDDGSRGSLAVEVKVDSAWSLKQLREMTPEDAHGVLLALGHTALMASPSDLASLTEYARPWRLVGPAEWASIVRRATSSEVFATYARSLEVEADDHERARTRVREGSRANFGRHPQTLEHWAYFAEIAAGAGDGLRWERKTLISGPLQTLWLPEWSDGGPYLELMGHGSKRVLCAKVWSTQGTLPERQRLVADGLADFEGRAGKRPSARDKTCTARSWTLDALSPLAASRLIGELEGAIRALVP
ncbi:MAG TPA: hypothetical protein VGX72_11940 [Solirubrobacteraceae bacterium]|nr:hypothetical protein [Solirubrobacteraceae bacterium]